MSDLEMKWHRFLIYFTVWAGAVMNLYNGIFTLTGIKYYILGISPELVYQLISKELQTIDIICGILFILLTLCQIIVIHIAKFRKNAPTVLISVYTIIFLLEFFYTIVASSFLGSRIIIEFAFIATGNLAMIIFNCYYFGHGKNMFFY